MSTIHIIIIIDEGYCIIYIVPIMYTLESYFYFQNLNNLSESYENVLENHTV